MEDYIPITKLNDFIFCPLSLYFRSCYNKFKENIFYQDKITTGKIEHEKIHQDKLKNRWKLINFPVYCPTYKLFGKIDEYDEITQELIEYKNNINKVYDGYKMQLYAQKACLESMGYMVKKMTLISIKTKEKIDIPLPSFSEVQKFEKLIESIKYYDIFKYLNYKNKCQNKCRKCIYKELCNDD